MTAPPQAVLKSLCISCRARLVCRFMEQLQPSKLSEERTLEGPGIRYKLEVKCFAVVDCPYYILGGA